MPGKSKSSKEVFELYKVCDGNDKLFDQLNQRLNEQWGISSATDTGDAQIISVILEAMYYDKVSNLDKSALALLRTTITAVMAAPTSK